MTIEDEIDRLYQLPLAEFTSARNALAKRAGGADGARIKTLEKPSLPAWAINQLYWHERKVFDHLSAAADKLRATHRALLGGKSVDLHKAETAHRDSARAAAARVRELVAKAGELPSDATMTAVTETLDALPAADEKPGRLTRPLKRMGFEALAGVPVRARAPETERNLSLVGKQNRKTPLPPLKPSAAQRREIESAEIRLRTAEAEERQAEKDLEQARRSVQRAEQALEQSSERRKKREADLKKIKEA